MAYWTSLKAKAARNRLILEQKSAGMSNKHIAEAHGITPSRVSCILAYTDKETRIAQWEAREAKQAEVRARLGRMTPEEREAIFS